MKIVLSGITTQTDWSWKKKTVFETFALISICYIYFVFVMNLILIHTTICCLFDCFSLLFRMSIQTHTTKKKNQRFDFRIYLHKHFWCWYYFSFGVTVKIAQYYRSKVKVRVRSAAICLLLYTIVVLQHFTASTFPPWSSQRFAAKIFRASNGVHR